jgi:hypothetical protein
MQKKEIKYYLEPRSPGSVASPGGSGLTEISGTLSARSPIFLLVN